MKEKIDQWKVISFHGKNPNDLRKSEVDKVGLNAWLKSGKLFAELNGFVIGSLNQVVNTRVYQEHTINDGLIEDDRVKRCKEKFETIQHATI